MVTTPDGTTYRFGGEFNPEENSQPYNSVFWTPVYYTNNPCDDNLALCQKAWRWNLDRVEDPHGNLATYFYDRAFNYYGARGNPYAGTYRRQYVRSGHLTRIEYGRRASESSTPPTRVIFETEARCENDCTWPSDYPDTPGDLSCTTGGYCNDHAPTFWSKQRLKYVKPQVYQQNSSAWQTVTVYDLAYDFPDPADPYSERKLWLASVTQRNPTLTESLPPVEFDYVMLENRLNHPGGVPAMEMPRIDTMTTALGGEVSFSYFQSHSCPTSGNPIRPAFDCFVAWDSGNPNYSSDDGWVWWRKWKVQILRTEDTFSGNPAQELSYSYSAPAWHYSNDPTLRDANQCSGCPTRHWNDFRGHQTVTVTDLAGAKSEHRFYQGMDQDRLGISGGSHSAGISLSDGSTRPDHNWLAGQAAETRQLDGSTALTRSVNWFDDDLTAGSGSYAARFVKLVKNEATLYATPDKSTRTEYQYDAYGNVTHELLYGDLTTTADDRTVQRAYLANSGAHIFDRLYWEKLWPGIVTTSAGGASSCTTYASSDVPKSISASGTPSIQSTLSIADGGVIDDVNLLDLHGAHTWINDLDFNLISPAGTAVQVLAQSCSSQNNFDLTLDDEAAPGAWPCPPTDGGAYQPSNPLAAFDGEARAGTWTLRVDDNWTNDGGSLDGWSLEICVATPPPLVEGSELALTVYGYDDSAPGVAPTVGNLTLARHYSQVAPTPLYVETATAYDARGRVTGVTDANGHSSSTGYHAFYGYAESATNALNHTVTTELDPGFGVATKITDANNKVTELAYDDFGRLTAVWLPTEAINMPTSGPASFEFNYASAARPAYAQSRTLQDAAASTYLESWSYVDGFGRELQSQRPSATAGERLVSSTAYNNVGLTAYSAAPYALAGAAGSGYAPPAWSALAGVQAPTYDALGRVVKHETRANGATLWESVTAYDGWTVSRYDANGHRTDHTMDAFGNLVQVVEHNDTGSGPVTYTTSYAYDLTGNLTGVTDHHGNVSGMSYDLLGRKTAMSDPDMGSWHYQYDAVGNLIAQQDGRGLWLHLGYDALDRLTSKRKESPSGTLLAEYVYDTLAKGQLYAAKAYDGSGNLQVESRTSALDDRYRATEQQWIMAGQGAFRMATAYNAADQTVTITYPGDNANGLGEVVTQSYDAMGQFSEVRGAGGDTYVASVDYNAQGKVTQLTSGNGLTRQYDYAADSLRLTGIRAGMAAPWSSLQDLSYTFDDVGNILTLTDGVNSGQVQSFGYDWLDRLISASTTAAGDGQYSHTYAYDAIGNITSYAGSAYTYSSRQPHAVTAAYGNSYGYDANGNQTSRTIGGVNLHHRLRRREPADGGQTGRDAPIGELRLRRRRQPRRGNGQRRDDRLHRRRSTSGRPAATNVLLRRAERHWWPSAAAGTPGTTASSTSCATIWAAAASSWTGAGLSPSASSTIPTAAIGGARSAT